MDSPRLFAVTSEHIGLLLFSFSVLHFLVVGSVRLIKLTHVGLQAHVKIVSRIVSYRIISHRDLQALSTARFRHAGPSASADTCFLIAAVTHN